MNTYAARLERGFDAQPVAPVEAMVRFCPGCGSVGEVPDAYRDCCPDGIGARVIPAALATKCHDLFRMALSAAVQPVVQFVAADDTEGGEL